jgi:2'-5' RNA ligase
VSGTDPTAGLGEPGPTERLFVGIWPPPEVMDVLSRFERPAIDAVRWTTPDQWHVTLAFLGDVKRSQIAEVGSALEAGTARAAAATEACLGPATRRVGRSILCVPVEGLDDLAALLRDALGPLVPAAGLERPFHGHLTLARARGRRTMPAPLAGHPLERRWRVREVGLVRSQLDPSGARYTTVATATVPS